MLNSIAIGSDHAGFELKEQIKSILSEWAITVQDFGTDSPESVDYPDFAHPLASSVEKGKHPLGILICGSANGVCMTANKHPNVRAAIAWNQEIAELARKHNDANVLCLPARFISVEEAKNITRSFLTSEFEGGRHGKRADKINC